MTKKHIAIVGGGPGGLCAAMLLSYRGFKVSVFEKNSQIGGRCRNIKQEGFTFDTGPTFLLMKDVLDEMFELTGRDSSDYLDFIRLDPMYKLVFDQQYIHVHSEPDKMLQELQRAFPDSPADYQKFLINEGRRFRYLYPCITRDYSYLKSYLSWDMVKALPFLALNHSVFSNLGRYFQTEKMRLIFSFQAKYLGMSPWECPAIFTMLSYIEHRYGIHHVKGGLNQISTAMAKVIEEQGGEIHYNSPVDSLITNHKTVTGIRLKDGTEVAADEVIVNADFAYAMTELVKPGVLKRYSAENIHKKEFSCSTFMMYLGLDKRYELSHHTVVFAKDYKQNVNNTFHNKILSDDFSFYVQNACVSDDSLAPPGKSTLYILVPVPNNKSQINWADEQRLMRQKVLDALSERLGLSDISQHIEVEKIMTPANWQSYENVFLGATFNLSHKFSQMLYFRPHNCFDELEHCYLVGGGTHPGSGLPTIYESAYISSKMICKKYGDSGLNQLRNSWAKK